MDGYYHFDQSTVIGLNLVQYNFLLLFNVTLRFQGSESPNNFKDMESIALYVTSRMTSQYGCFMSFSGRYVAKSWTLDLDKNNC